MELNPTLVQLRQLLLCQRNPQGIWEGHLSSSALSTATALFALASVDAQRHNMLIERGLIWLSTHQNHDGGWGDTPASPSNLSTTLLAYSALTVTPAHRDIEERCEVYLKKTIGSLQPHDLAHAVDTAYGGDKTFSVPILTMCALAGRLGEQGWSLVRALPFELAALPRQLFAWLRLPVVSYALPALIAMGQVRFCQAPPHCPIKRQLRKHTQNKTLRLLEQLQPDNGGFLEAPPLTSFVAMSLAGSGQKDHPVTTLAIQFLADTVREDGSWPIDTNLATWVTTLAVNGMCVAGQQDQHLHPQTQNQILNWLLSTQQCRVHPYTQSTPGGWAWSDRPGAVPDADDTAGVLLALSHLGSDQDRVHLAAEAGLQWLLSIQNRNGGIPTFCRGWTKLPFDQSCPDITAHVIAAWTLWYPHLKHPLSTQVRHARERALQYLTKTQRPNGSWLPLWFGNQQTPQLNNPVYGTARVLSHTAGLQAFSLPSKKGLTWLLEAQHPSGGWGGDQQTPPSLEETALALDALAAQGPSEVTRTARERGTFWLIEQLQKDTTPTPIGLYFARLWYSEDLYPLVFSLSALERLQGLAIQEETP